jgi:hypothetical protein
MEYQLCTDDEVAAMRPGREYLIVRDPGFNVTPVEGGLTGWVSTDAAARRAESHPGQYTFTRCADRPPLRARCLRVQTAPRGNAIAILLYTDHGETGRRTRHVVSARSLVSITPAPRS